MNHAFTVEPNLAFKRRIIGLDAHDLSTCYQCGTCSVVCPVSTDDAPFPRKEMVWTQWGLEERLMNDAAIWLCHQCQMCTTYCPREAKPANVMAALREYSISFHAFPRFMGVALSEPKYLPLLFALPIVLLLAAVGLAGNLSGLPDGEVIFRAFLPYALIETVFVTGVAFALVAGAVGAIRYWLGMSRAEAGSASAAGRDSLFACLKEVVADIFTHDKFRTCERDRVGERETHKAHMPHGHIAVFFGFAGLLLTTTIVYIMIEGFDIFTPLPPLSPVKLLGNASGVAVLFGALLFIVRRLLDKEKAGKTTYNDWLFVSVLLLVVLTGYGSQIARLSGIGALAYPTYFVHLVFIFFLLVYSPYSKFAHVYFRPVAMLYARIREKRTGLRF